MKQGANNSLHGLPRAPGLVAGVIDLWPLELPAPSELQLDRRDQAFENLSGFSGYLKCFALCSKLPDSWKTGPTHSEHTQTQKLISEVLGELGDTERMQRNIVPVFLKYIGQDHKTINLSTSDGYLGTVSKSRLQTIQSLTRKPGRWFYYNLHSRLLFLTPDNKLLLGSAECFIGR